jgi:hypothetical protein
LLARCATSFLSAHLYPHAMYKHVSRLPSRSLSEHVCLTCQRQLHIAPRLRKEESDDWLSNFNDLSIEGETRPNKSDQVPRKSQENGTLIAKGQTKQGEIEQTQARARQWGKSEADGEKLRKIHGKPNSRTAGRAHSVQGLKAKFKGTASDDKSRKLRSAELDDISSRALEGIPEHLKSTTGASDDVRKTYESVLDNLLNDPVLTVNDEAPIQPAYSRPRFAHKQAQKVSISAVDDIQVAGGVTSSSARPLGIAAQPVDLEREKLMSIATKARLVRERPKWGGMTAVADEGPLFKASFDVLQKADKVSAPPERPSTAYSDKPWGFKGSSVDNGFAHSPGGLAAGQGSESAALPSAHEETDASQSRSFAGMMGFKRLRNMLYGSESADKTGTTQSEGETALSTGEVDVASKEEAGHIMDSQPQAVPEEDPFSIAGPAAVKPEESNAVGSSSVTGTAMTLRRQRYRQQRQIRKQAERQAAEQEAEQAAQADDGAGLLPENKGQSISDVMVGRDLTEAMHSEHDAEPATNYGYAEDAESDLPLITAKDLQITPLNIKQPPVPGLSYGLDRVLFNPGVTSLQDQHSRVYNFDPYLQHVMPVQEFDFNALAQYKTSSQDSALSEIAKAHSKKYVGSTSSMTSTLSHFHFLLSGWRDLNLGMLSRQFPEDRVTFTAINRAPTAIFLRWKNGTYAIDADKEHDSGNILMMLGKSMEKLLTMSRSEYERYRKSDPRDITEEERNRPEAYEYTAMGDFLMRSQLDAYDSRLPGTGTFDIKTRAIASIRMSTADYKPMLGYEILTQQGKWESYEREYYDMMRSTMLKYMLQARMGRMDGIFMAYHNVERIFGFQYMPISEIDRAIHGQHDRCLGDQEFKLSVDMLNKVLEQATAKFPNKSLRLHFETRSVPLTAMYVFAEPMEDDQIDQIQSKSKEKVAEFERKMMGIEAREDKEIAENDEDSTNVTSTPLLESGEHRPLYAATILVGSIVNGERVQRPEHLKPEDDWSVEYLLKEMDDPVAAWATYEQCKAKRKQTFSSATATGDEGEAESLEGAEPNFEMHDNEGSLRTFENIYLENLRRLAEKGREFRQKIDDAEKDHDKVVYRGTANSETIGAKQQQAVVKTAAPSDESVINTVDEYMSWMYGNKEDFVPEQSAEVPSPEPEIRGVEDYMSWMYKDRN